MDSGDKDVTIINIHNKVSKKLSKTSSFEFEVYI